MGSLGKRFRQGPCKWGRRGRLQERRPNGKAREFISASYTAGMAYLRRYSQQVPPAMKVVDALQAHQGLAHLNELAAGSKARLECVRAAIPKSLHGALLAGPLDDSGWTLLARNAAAAAKLRQLKPHLELLLAERFGAQAQLRIKVLGGFG